MAARVQDRASHLELWMQPCLRGSPALTTPTALLTVTRARDNKRVCKIHRGRKDCQERRGGDWLEKIQPVALGRTNENTEIESEGDTWKVLRVERRQVVRSRALSWPHEPPGATRILDEGRVVCRLARCA